MNEIFGVPVTTLTAVLVGALALSIAYLIWIAWRRPVLFKMGMRNIPRRKAQTALIVVGLMLSTLLISASLGTGDTLTHSMTVDVYRNLGEVDELVVSSPAFDAASIETTAKIDADALSLVDEALAGNGDVDGVMPYLEERFPARNLTKGQAEPDIVVVGIDPARLETMGGLEATRGPAIEAASFAPGVVVLSESAAHDLDAAIGDLILIGPEGTGFELTVSGIAEDTFLSGYRRGREDYLEYPGMAVSLPALQELTGQEGLLSGIAISNEGDARAGHALTDEVKEALEGPLAGTGLGVDPVKAATVEDGESIATMFTTIFLVLGLFSVVSGLLLIVLIFSMLAAERRPEMGMARAVGMRSSQLTRQFISEGAGYALIAGLIGALLGAAASVGIAHVMKWLFGQYVPIEPHVEPRSIVLAYSLGVVITFLTIVVSARRISKLNVVAAIRDIPEIGNGKRRLRALVLGVLLVAAGGAAAMMGLGGDQASFFFMGASLAILGVAVVAKFAGVPSRLVFSVTGLLVLALWLTPESVGSKIWGELEQGVEMYFVAGIFMVVGATIVIAQNLDLLLRGVSLTGRLFSSKLPAVRTAVAYPAAARGRTGLTIAMFSLIVFSVVLMGTMNENYGALYTSDKADAGWHVRADVNGSEVIDGFTGELEKAGVDTSQIVANGASTSPNREASQVRIAGASAWKQWPLIGVDDAFLEGAELAFGERAAGYPTDASIVQALLTEPNVAVVDAQTLAGGGDFGSDPEAFVLDGVEAGDQDFAPVQVELVGASGQVHVVTVIGVISEDISTLYGIYAAQETIDAIAPTTAKTSYYLALEDPAQADAMAKAVEAAMIDQGVQGVSIEEEIQEALEQNSGFLKLIEGFMGLGLIVGLAAVGVIAFRSVVERRQQIGMLRAIGYRRGLISLSFGLETLFVVGIGIVAGTTLGVGLGYNLFNSEDVGAGAGAFLVPWQLIGIVVAGTLSVAALMTWIPARQASSVAPAEALRYE
jgi:putative ABC transport system permease protein